MVAWAGALRPALEPLLTFAPPEVVYLTYGKCFSLMVFGWMAGLLALHARQAANAVRLERWGFRVAFAGTMLGIIGGIGAHWIGSVWRRAVGISFVAFLVPTLLLFNIGFPLFGIGTLRAKAAPRPGAWLLTVGGFPGIFLLTFLTGQLTLGLPTSRRMASSSESDSTPRSFWPLSTPDARQFAEAMWHPRNRFVTRGSP